MASFGCTSDAGVCVPCGVNTTLVNHPAANIPINSIKKPVFEAIEFHNWVRLVMDCSLNYKPTIQIGIWFLRILFEGLIKIGFVWQWLAGEHFEFGLFLEVVGQRPLVIELKRQELLFGID